MSPRLCWVCMHTVAHTLVSCRLYILKITLAIMTIVHHDDIKMAIKSLHICDNGAEYYELSLTKIK